MEKHSELGRVRTWLLATVAPQRSKLRWGPCWELRTWAHGRMSGSTSAGDASGMGSCATNTQYVSLVHGVGTMGTCGNARKGFQKTTDNNKT